MVTYEFFNVSSGDSVVVQVNGKYVAGIALVQARDEEGCTTRYEVPVYDEFQRRTFVQVDEFSHVRAFERWVDATGYAKFLNTPEEVDESAPHGVVMV